MLESQQPKKYTGQALLTTQQRTRKQQLAMLSTIQANRLLAQKMD